MNPQSTQQGVAFSINDMQIKISLGYSVQKQKKTFNNEKLYPPPDLLIYNQNEKTFYFLPYIFFQKIHKKLNFKQYYPQSVSDSLKNFVMESHNKDLIKNNFPEFYLFLIELPYFSVMF